jgi:thiamine pyrophosphate-dependent acetolactate synthase large subunit-like protein
MANCSPDGKAGLPWPSRVVVPSRRARSGIRLRFRGQVRGSLSGNLATMGPGVPYGIGAKFGHPDRPVIVFAGDGAMQMSR